MRCFLFWKVNRLKSLICNKNLISGSYFSNITEIFNVLIDKEKEVLKTILDRGPCQYKEYEIYII